MTRLDALKKLAADVDAGSLPIWPVTFKAIGENGHIADAAFHGSLDAAQALHEAVLPKAWAHIRLAGKYGHCTVDLDGDEYEANNQPTAACAWLLAILLALIAQEEGQ